MGPRSAEILAAEQREIKKLLASLAALVELPVAEPPHPVKPQGRKKPMAITATRTVRELATELPGATRIFEKLGIDYCCGGARTLRDACTDARLTVDDVIRSLEQSEARQPGAPAPDWTTAPLNALTAHIVNKHHAYVRQEVRRIQALLAKVIAAHGQNHPEVAQIQENFEDLGNELTSHMFKEENVLFPYIDSMQAAVDRGQPVPPPFFGTVRNPVQMMMMEHDGAGEKLKAMRDLSSGYSVPADGCATYASLYRALGEFEQDLHQHIHLENNILFPRAVKMERV